MGLCRMTVPALPATQSAGVATSAYANNIRSLQQWHRDTAPVFKGLAWDGTGGLQAGVSGDIATSTATTLGFGDGGSFENTPVINVGGWTVQGSDSDPESLVVPESGIYAVSVFNNWAANSSGNRSTQIVLNGSGVSGGRVVGPAAPTGVTMQNLTTVLDLAANDELDTALYQTSGSSLDATVYLTAHWIRST